MSALLLAALLAAADRPVVLEVKTDPEVAPLPPHVTFEQAKAFMSSMAKGDKGAGRVMMETVRQLVGGHPKAD